SGRAGALCHPRTFAPLRLFGHERRRETRDAGARAVSPGSARSAGDRARGRMRFGLPLEKATALVVRTVDWSDTSRIATLWTREFGRVRVLAKGARRLKSNFDTALDLLTVSSIVLLRKSSGTLDLLTEAQVVKRFPRLRADLQALYSAYYVAEL